MSQIFLNIDLAQRGPARPADGCHYWLTPPALRAALDREFAFDFDPCPWPRPADLDGLSAPWGRRNFVNPPFVALPSWIRKAIRERDAGNLCVLLLPFYHQHTLLCSSLTPDCRDLGRVKFLSIEDGTPSPRGFPCALFVLRPRSH